MDVDPEEKRIDDSYDLSRRLVDWFDGQAEYPDHFAHYTSASSASQIIQSGKIFLFNALTLNDEQEIDHALEFITQAFQQEPLKKFNSLVAKFLISRKSVHPSVYVFCTLQADSLPEMDNLSMWRAYGDDGKGVALAFKKKALLNAAGDLKLERPRMVRVLYQREDKLALLRDMTTRFEAECAQMKYSIEDMADALCNALWRLVPVFKHVAFATENEWRLVLQVRKSLGQVSGGDTDAIDFLPGDGRPYVALELDKLPGKGFLSRLDAGPIAHVLVGPSKHARHNAGIVGAALTKTHARAHVSLSQIPYRGRA